MLYVIDICSLTSFICCCCLSSIFLFFFSNFLLSFSAFFTCFLSALAAAFAAFVGSIESLESKLGKSSSSCVDSRADAALDAASYKLFVLSVAVTCFFIFLIFCFGANVASTGELNDEKLVGSGISDVLRENSLPLLVSPLEPEEYVLISFFGTVHVGHSVSKSLLLRRELAIRAAKKQTSF